MAGVITCPSGLTGRIRGMKVQEERVLADRKLAKSGGQMDELLSACWEEMHCANQILGRCALSASIRVSEARACRTSPPWWPTRGRGRDPAPAGHPPG